MAGRLKNPRGRRGSGAAGAPCTRAAEAAADLRQLARDAALAALKRLAELARSGDERVALAASQELLNRALGKSAAAGVDDSPAERPLTIKIIRFSERSKSGEREDQQS